MNEKGQEKVVGHLKEWFTNAGVQYDDKPNMASESVLNLIDKVPELDQLYKESGSYKVDVKKMLIMI